MTTATPQIEKCLEHVRDWRMNDVQIDSTRRLVRNIALTGIESRNGYRYSEQALREAAPHYAGKPVFLDHAPNVARPHDRSARDLVGSIVNPRYQEGRIRADVQTLTTEAATTFLALAESNQPAVGMSHVVLVERDVAENVVTRIHDVISVDAVVFPATTQTFQESQTSPNPDITALTAQLTRITIERDTLLQERDDLRRELNNQREQLHLTSQLTAEQTRISELVRTARLPAFAVTPEFEQQLLTTPDDSTRQSLIQERLTLIRHITSSHPQSTPRPLDNDTSQDTALIRAIKAAG